MSGRQEALTKSDRVLRVEDLTHHRRTVSGRLIVEPDWFLREAAGVRSPRHAGETMGQYRERKAKRRRVLIQAGWVLLTVALLVAMRVW